MPIRKVQNLWSFIIILLAFSAFSGCSTPIITYVADTEIAENLETVRFVSIRSRPDPRFQQSRPKITDTLQLPDKAGYSTFKADDYTATFATRVATPDKVPVDFQKKVQGTDLKALGTLSLKRTDYGLMVAYDFEENITDIVERTEGEETLERSAKILTELLCESLNKNLGSDYDFTEFNNYLRRELPRLATDLYRDAWEVQLYKANKSRADNSRAEWDAHLRRELARLGLFMEPFASRQAKQHNEQVWWKFLDDRLAEMVKPTQDGVPPMTSSFFRNKENQMSLLMQIIKSAADTFGSLPGFINELEIPIYAGAFGNLKVPFAVDGTGIRPAPPPPDLKFLFRARIPGTLIKSNGVRDLDGRILWRFDAGDAALTGYRMWASTLDINEEAIKKMGLTGFPGSLSVVEQFHACFLDSRGHFDANLGRLMKKCISEGSFAALRNEAAPALPGNLPRNGEITEDHNISPQQAQKLLGLLGAFIKNGKSSSSAKTDGE